MGGLWLEMICSVRLESVPTLEDYSDRYKKRKERKKGGAVMPLLISVQYITKDLNSTVSHQNRNRNKDKHCDLNSYLNKYSASRHQAPASVDAETIFPLYFSI